MRRRPSRLSQSRFAASTVLLVACAACTTYADLPIDQQNVDGTDGAGARSSSTSGDDRGADSTTNLGGAATSTVTLGSTSASDSTTGSGGDTTDTTSTGGTGGVAPDSSSGGAPNPAAGGTGGEAASEGGTGGTGATGGSAGAGGSGATGGAGNGGGGTGGDTTTGTVVTTGGTTSTSTFRYVRLVAMSSQNGAPYTAIAELELLDAAGQPIDPSGWTATADSEETVDEIAPASQAIDGDTNSFWHTEWGDYEAPLPHYLQIDLASPEEITGFVYTPRQGGIDNGHILDWEFYLSNSATDPGSAVDSGSFAAGETLQTVNLP